MGIRCFSRKYRVDLGRFYLEVFTQTYFLFRNQRFSDGFVNVFYSANLTHFPPGPDLRAEGDGRMGHTLRKVLFVAPLLYGVYHRRRTPTPESCHILKGTFCKYHLKYSFCADPNAGKLEVGLTDLTESEVWLVTNKTNMTKANIKPKLCRTKYMKPEKHEKATLTQ